MKNTILYCCLFFIFSCTSTQKEATNGGNTTPPNPPEKDMTACTTRGVVTDFSGLDGCKLLIVLGDKKKFLASKLPRGVRLVEGQHLLFGYKEIADGVSICMTEDKIVEITCLEVTAGPKPGKKDCVDTNKPLDVLWLKKNIARYQPHQIIKYKFRKDGWAYLHKTKTHRKLFDCQGNLVCEATNDAPKDDSCVDVYLQYLRNGKVIWQGEGPGN